MIELHVWGFDGDISIVSPPCIASAWILNLIVMSQNVPFRIIPSNNTHLSKLNELPLLFDDGMQYSGYRSIVSYLSSRYGNGNTIPLLENDKLLDDSLISFLETKLEALNKYNLFSNSKNYENYTRKLFSKFFPFPMMYNQALNFYNEAQRQVQLLGLGETKSSFLNFTSSGDNTQTEYFNGELDEGAENSKAISGLHEKSLMQKSEAKKALRESKSSMRCLILAEQFLERLEKLKAEQNKEGKFTFGNLPSAGDILCLAYFSSLTHPSLPDRFINNFLTTNNSAWFRSYLDRLRDVQFGSPKASAFRKPTGKEVPSLFNEVGYWTGLISY